nr:immunoglobulin light chain junction region [Macaca mulatta]
CLSYDTSLSARLV